ncbi:ATP-binding cassette domain-containing protein [Nocardia sp. NBC_00565]|uniref:ABC transporter ATP-binding protein n=1 Tax=Nocardia sp. NBC_00565 TaxID=2975993 RepID=UPI002E812B10|nr:ATP-binding cassette domain-containing protein [Nocardia sp. NBC_00565]WUC05063.1 ATP-binding cassette domain-containing protein [Nocardia sp. NBC_00565]
MTATVAPTATQFPASGSAEPTVVSITGLRKAFGTKTVLDGVDLTIRRGEFVVLLGPSGTGKTTLLRLLTGLEVPDAGEVLVPGRRTTVYQEPRLIPSKRVLANVIVGQPRSRKHREAGLRALAEVNLDGKARQWPATLSGGEAQRAALARALVREPELLLLDEPFAALDALTRLQMQDLVGDLVARHRPAVLMVTHDVDEAVRLADRVLILDHGRFAVDERIDLTRPRDRTNPETIRYQAEFLAELGVGPSRSGRES